MLADLAGRDQVENPHGGDDTRKWGPPFVTAHDGENLSAAYYHSCNRGKRSIAIDFSTSEGAETVRQLVATADVLIENFKLGGLKKYGLDYESLKKINPKLVYCSITGFGQDGPYAPRAGYDFIVQGMSGLMSITGPAGGEPEGRRGRYRPLHRALFSDRHPGSARHARRQARASTSTWRCSTRECRARQQNLNFLVSGKSPVQMGNASQHRALQCCRGRRAFHPGGRQ